MQGLPSVQEMEAYIRQAAQARGIDPDIAVRVAKSEGLAPGTWQANGILSYGRERSYGPFQLHVDPRKGKAGMGNDFINATGLDPADPKNWKQGVDFALDQATKLGWAPWYGRENADVGVWDGITRGFNVQPASGPPPYSAGPGRGSMAGYRTPGSYEAGQFIPGVDKTFYADNSPALPGNQGQGVGAALGGFAGGPTEVAMRNIENFRAVPAKTTGDFRPTNFQRMEARKAMEGDQSQKARLLKAAGLDPTGKTRTAPRGTEQGILDMLKGGMDDNTGPSLDAKLAAIPQNIQSGLQGGILGKLFNLFG